MEGDRDINKRRASDDVQRPRKKMRCHNLNSATGHSDVRAEDMTWISSSPEDERIFEMSSSGNTSRAHFKNKYYEHVPIGAGGFGSVYYGWCKRDLTLIILKQLVDAAIDLHSKGIFHRDFKLQNVLIQKVPGVPRVRIIDFGCGLFSKESPYESFCGMISKYWARPTTVWQLGGLFYSLLSGQEDFTTIDFINKNIEVNSALSTDVKILLYMCLARDPTLRSTLEELKNSRFLNNPALCLPNVTY
ncbi:Serine/threonine-protein kinase pim-2 [Nibea albiflora]|nr:Serine/threonine-protein kinase pim-2 [Nibea albiflora]